jgi:hypothetical protein
MLKKIAISPESTNYGDNDANVAYLYRGYYIWKSTQVYVGDRGGNRDEWNYGPAVIHTPDAELGEEFEPYWDDTGLVNACESRRDCIACIDGRLAEQAPEQAQPDPDAVENVTLTVSLNQARTILAALSRRCDELESLGGSQAEGLLAETRAIYQGIDQQVFQGAAK